MKWIAPVWLQGGGSLFSTGGDSTTAWKGELMLRWIQQYLGTGTLGVGSRFSSDGVGCWWRHFPHRAVGKPYEEWARSPSRVSSFTSCSPFPLCHLWNEIQLGLRFTGLHLFSALPVHKFMIALLDAKHQDICFSACGVLLNLTVDRDKRVILKEGGGIKK